MRRLWSGEPAEQAPGMPLRRGFALARNRRDGGEVNPNAYG